MPLYAVFSAFILLLISSNSFAADLFNMLQRMSDADQMQNYQGTFILRKTDSLSTLRVTHGYDEDGIWESLEALNGEPRKVVRRNNEVISIFPVRELLTIRHNQPKQSLHFQLPDNIKQLGLFYSLKQLPDDRIANHQVLVLDLIPNDKLRYGYRYWVDKNTGMLLRCDLMDEDNRVVEQMMFTSLEYLAQTPEPTFDLRHYQHYQQQFFNDPEIDIKHSTPLKWAINTLPKGFMLTQRTMRDRQTSLSQNAAKHNQQQPALLHLVYSDGLASVSVFIEKSQAAENHQAGTSSMGAVNAFGHKIDDYFVTVVGEVPVKTVRAMAQSAVKLP